MNASSQRLSGRVAVVGSIDTDLVVRTEQLPRPGETVLGGRFASVQGGKGANQAVAFAAGHDLPVAKRLAGSGTAGTAVEGAGVGYPTAVAKM